MAAQALPAGHRTIRTGLKRYLGLLTAVVTDGREHLPLRPRPEARAPAMALGLPPPRVHQVRSAGCLAAHSKLRGAIPPTPRQQGIETPGSSVSSHWSWARLLKRVVSIDRKRCPRWYQGAWRRIAATTSRPIIRRLLLHLQLAADPPSLAPARLEPDRFAWASA